MNTIFCVIFTLLTIGSNVFSQDLKRISITDFSFPGVAIRAIDAINDSTVWFAGSKGVWGYTQNSGKTWTIDTLKIDRANPEIRSVKVTPNGNIYLVNIANPAGVYKSINKGKSWTLVYTDTAQDAFFDAIDFWDNQNGILLGDASKNCLHIAITKNGGDSWFRVDCDSIPSTLFGENPFAASNSNIGLGPSSVFIPTGGKSKSRVFYSTNLGNSWKVSSTPIIAGEQMTGIFSIDMSSDSIGIVAGGNWDKADMECNNLALTRNGGLTWEPLNNKNNSSYISCIKFLPDGSNQFLISLSARVREGKSAIGIYSFITNKWQIFDNPKNYLAIQLSSKNYGWVSGKGWIGHLEIKN
ncbi:MAG: WD40/YVTN/BNR-like repeat-containing protein [Salibacteraceae bacterium]